MGIHVAIDGKRFFQNAAGLGRYSRTLVAGLLSKEFAHRIKITLFKPKGRVRFSVGEYPNLEVVRAKHPLGGDLGNGLWRFFRLPRLLRRNDISLFHGPSHILPPKSRCPMVVTMHDLIFLRYPHYFPTWDRNYYRHAFKNAAARADHIISVSQATKQDLIDLLAIPEEKISVVYPAMDDAFRPLDQNRLAKIRSKHALPHRYILFVGTIEPRKNIVRTAKAFDSLQAAGKIDAQTQFIVVGTKGWFFDEIIKELETLPCRSRIRLLGGVSQEDLSGIYQMATLMAYPSECEGFGYPVIEAMRLGTPVLTSNCSSLSEAGGDAALLVNPLDVEEIAHGMLRLIDDQVVRQTAIKAGIDHAKNFNPMKMASQTLSIYTRFAR